MESVCFTNAFMHIVKKNFHAIISFKKLSGSFLIGVLNTLSVRDMVIDRTDVKKHAKIIVATAQQSGGWGN